MVEDRRILRTIADYGAGGFSGGRRRGWLLGLTLSDSFDAASDGQAAKTDDIGAGCRENADECLRAAEQATDQVKKANWIEFADEWLWLADAADHFSSERQAHQEP
jgi:hypothetical protein